MVSLGVGVVRQVVGPCLGGISSCCKVVSLGVGVVRQVV